MDCRDAQPRLLEYHRTRLAPEDHERIGAHLDGCAACARAHAAEQALSVLLDTRVPRHACLREKWRAGKSSSLLNVLCRCPARR